MSTTSSTVKFYKETRLILSLYQPADGYLRGVGRQVLDLLRKYKMVNGINIADTSPQANGVEDLALLYVLDNKNEGADLYVSTKEAEGDYNYEIHFSAKGTVDNLDRIYAQKLSEDAFEGDLEQFAFLVAVAKE